jgi:hypothetical protein
MPNAVRCNDLLGGWHHTLHLVLFLARNIRLPFPTYPVIRVGRKSKSIVAGVATKIVLHIVGPWTALGEV